MIKTIRFENFRIIQKEQSNTGNRICQVCSNKFQGNIRSNFCGKCFIVLKCSYCGKYRSIQSGSHPFYDMIRKSNSNESVLDFFNRISNENVCSRSCSIAKRNTKSKSFGKCKICGKESNLYYNVCSSCTPANKVTNKFCYICEKITPHNGDRCLSCQATEMRKSDYFGSEKHKEIASKNCIIMNNKNHENNHWQSEEMINLNKEKVRKMIQFNFENDIYSKNGIRKRFCQICKEETYHNGTTCLQCNPDKMGGKQPNFIIKNNVKFYKGEPVEEIIKKLDFGEYKVEDFPGWNKRFGEWYYNQENILTDEITKLNGSLFEIKDKVEYYYDKSIKDYIPWKDYKKKFVLKNTNFSLPEGFELYTTFREQDSLNWSNARLAFEKNLVENNINWFVYIKFYYDINNNLKPLVVGKSGSMNVNSNGSDISFSINGDDGPARRFLKENNFNWCKTQIAIMKCNNEQEALNKEKEIQEKYSLFGS